MAKRGVVIQGSFIGGRFRLPGVASTAAAVQPRMASTQRHQPHTHLNQNPARQPSTAQAKMVQPRAGHQNAAPARGTAPVVQRHAVVQRHGNGEAFQLPAHLSNFGGAAGQRLPTDVLQKMESFFDTSFTDVRVHVGPQATAIGALAFTQGSNLYFAQGQYSPHTSRGQQILGHELAHVVQQRSGRVRNPFAAGVAVVQDRTMEAEADRLGQLAAAHQATVQPKMLVANKAANNSSAASTIQRALTFTTARSAWRDDSRGTCRWCMRAIGWRSRHHCRVCGELVCEQCSPSKYAVTNPQTSDGNRSKGGQSTERVCVNCVLERKIAIAAAGSAEFRNLRARAGDPPVEWVEGAWPNCDGRRIILNPHRDDPFNTYVFELTNAADMRQRRVVSEPRTMEEYAFNIEYTEYLGTMWHNEVVRDINSHQRDFSVSERFAPNRPDETAFQRHMQQQVTSGHTGMYHDQWRERLARQERERRRQVEQQRRLKQQTRQWLSDTEDAWQRALRRM